MGSQRSLLVSMSLRPSGRLHSCSSDKKHALVKGQGMLVIKKGRDEDHYCLPCAMKFVATAESRLSDLRRQIAATSNLAVGPGGGPQ